MKKRIICKNASLGYEDGIVTENLNFTVNSGDYLCILGENGSGKSTLIKALLGLKPAVSGEIIWEGLSAQDIGYLPQQTPVQRDFPASVREIVLSGCLSRCGLRPFYNKAEKQLSEDNMKKLHIEHLAGHCYRELSGGQQQRVLLARALCATSEMLLLDEPATALDPKAQADLYELIADLNRSGITIIMVSHDITASLKYATHILHIAKKQLFFGNVNDYINSSTGFAETEV
ncbi:MAG: metal ABC transporter ATP-binding protein [Muribaculaceae bacterium]|nr:metal ABC transporter ATP-binding protein [Alistipes senegalensis]MCM1474407.1 metal ABC transporter ATP-binding protein [Muribaculaceae bacterium]